MVGPPLLGSERVLLRLPSWLGDFVAAEPLLRALSARLAEVSPGGSLTLVGREAFLALLDEPRRARWLIDEPGSPSSARAWRGHDVALLCTGSFRSAWQAWRAGIPRRVGFARDGRGWLLSDTLVPARERGGLPLGLGRAGRGRRILPRPLGRSLVELGALLGLTVAQREPRLALRPQAREAARARRASLGLDPDAPFILASVGARRGSSKGVPSELWAGALRALASSRRGHALVLACAPGEELALAAVQEGLGDMRALALRDPAAPLDELLAHCAEAALLLCADSGPRHLARALGRPAVVISGPTDPRHCGVGPHERVVRVPVPCGPCHLESCPLSAAEHLRCMHSITPEAIARSAEALLGGAA